MVLWCIIRKTISLNVVLILSVNLYFFYHSNGRYEHPLLIEGRDKGEWVLPITVHAPPPRHQPAHTRSERPDSLGPMWNRN